MFKTELVLSVSEEQDQADSDKKMNGDELIRVAARLSKILGDSGVLIGGLAVSAWGHVRATEDVDFVSSLEPQDVQARLGANGIVSELVRGDALQGDIPWVIRGDTEGVPFQILPPLVPLDWDRVTEIAMPDGGDLRVVDIDDLLHLKLKAGGVRDLWDVAMLTREDPGRRDKARSLAKSCGVLDELDRWLTDPRLKGR